MRKKKIQLGSVSKCTKEKITSGMNICRAEIITLYLLRASCLSKAFSSFCQNTRLSCF